MAFSVPPWFSLLFYSRLSESITAGKFLPIRLIRGELYMRRFFVILLILIATNSAFAQSSQKIAGDPNEAQLITSDIKNFWAAYDRAKPDNQVAILDKEYLGRGSIGLQDFVKLRIGSADNLVKTINAHLKYYASIRESTLRVEEMRPRIRAAFYALKYLYEDAVFPDVYFVIGRMNSGGTLSDRALLIGTEMYGKTQNMPVEELSDWLRQVLGTIEGIPHIVAHELIHYQQKYSGESASPLLAQSIREGSADFIAELISGRHINTHIHEYGNPRERELWTAFKADMNGKDFSRWLYNPGLVKDRPADLGYYMGYKIVESYYNRAKDKRQAIREILLIKDMNQFLKESGYEEKFSK
jgi:hypothetical protein